jgi:hypothetical protein
MLSPAWLAVGGPNLARGGDAWDFTPLAVSFVAMIVLRFVFRVRITPIVAGCCVLGSIPFLWLGDTIGFPATSALVFTGAAATAVVLRRTRRIS